MLSLCWLVYTGTFSWPDGDVYDGEWRDGVQQGRGKCNCGDCPYDSPAHFLISYDGIWMLKRIFGGISVCKSVKLHSFQSTTRINKMGRQCEFFQFWQSASSISPNFNPPIAGDRAVDPGRRQGIWGLICCWHADCWHLYWSVRRGVRRCFPCWRAREHESSKSFENFVLNSLWTICCWTVKIVLKIRLI